MSAAVVTTYPTLSLSDFFLCCSLLLVGVFAFFGCNPAVHKYVRRRLQPWVRKHVEQGLEWVEYAQSFDHPILTRLCAISSCTVTVSFYATVLPALGWLYDGNLAASWVLLLTAVLYVGNSLKDLIGGPRPFSVHKGVRLVTDAESDDAQIHAKEYGIPSSHTMNTMAMNFYLVHHITKEMQLSSAATGVLYALAAAGVVWVAFTRLYLGFHSPIDITAGALFAFAIFTPFRALSDVFFVWLDNSPYPGFQMLLLLVVLMRVHPQPEEYTPSFEYTVSFAGVTFGMVSAISRSTAFLEVMNYVPSLLTAWGIMFALRRLILGILVVVIMTPVCKSVLLGVLPTLYRWFPLSLRKLWQPPVQSLCTCKGSPSCTHTTIPINANGHPWDADCTARFFSYASIGWAVFELSPRMFIALGW